MKNKANLKFEQWDIVYSKTDIKKKNPFLILMVSLNQKWDYFCRVFDKTGKVEQYYLKENEVFK